MELRNGLGLMAKLGGGIIAGIAVLALYALIGAISAGTTAAVVAAALLFLGFVNMATAQAIFLVIMAGGAVLSIIGGVIQLVLIK